MRIRLPFAIAFAALLLFSGYLGLAAITIPAVAGYQHTDKGLHLITFFLLTVVFYWIFDTSRRRAVHLTLITCTGALSCGSEILQGLLPNGRDFDPFDIAANVLGSAVALGLCAWYHQRMSDRRRAAKGYGAVSGDEEEGGAGDFELDESRIPEGQETGVANEVDIDHELENWDENEADDWDDDEQPASTTNGSTAKPADDLKIDKAKLDDSVGKNKRDD